MEEDWDDRIAGESGGVNDKTDIESRFGDDLFFVFCSFGSDGFKV